MYILNYVQHTKSEDVVAPSLTFATTDEWKARYHQEMSYAMSSADFLGLSVLVTDGSLNKVFYDNWVREVEQPAPKPED